MERMKVLLVPLNDTSISYISPSGKLNIKPALSRNRKHVRIFFASFGKSVGNWRTQR